MRPIRPSIRPDIPSDIHRGMAHSGPRRPGQARRRSRGGSPRRRRRTARPSPRRSCPARHRPAGHGRHAGSR
jgi:hypothetical protein